MANTTKTVCPITREQFANEAPAIVVNIGGQTFTLAPREFSTGSMGWNLSDKIRVTIGGKEVTVQIGLNLTVVGSKDLPPKASA